MVDLLVKEGGSGGVLYGREHPCLHSRPTSLERFLGVVDWNLYSRHKKCFLTICQISHGGRCTCFTPLDSIQKALKECGSPSPYHICACLLPFDEHYSHSSQQWRARKHTPLLSHPKAFLELNKSKGRKHLQFSCCNSDSCSQDFTRFTTFLRSCYLKWDPSSAPWQVHQTPTDSLLNFVSLVCKDLCRASRANSAILVTPGQANHTKIEIGPLHLEGTAPMEVTQVIIHCCQSTC